MKAADAKKFATTRKEAGVPAVFIARKAGISIPTLRRFEAGEKIRVGNLEKLIHAYRSIGLVDGAGPEREEPDPVECNGKHDASWLRSQIAAHTRGRELTTNRKLFVYSDDDLYDLGRKVMLACGKNIE